MKPTSGQGKKTKDEIINMSDLKDQSANEGNEDNAQVVNVPDPNDQVGTSTFIQRLRVCLAKLLGGDCMVYQLTDEHIKKIHELETALANERVKNQQQQIKLAEERQLIEKQQSDLKDAEAEIQKQQDELTKARKEIQQLETALANERVKIRKLQNKLKKAENEIEDLKHEQKKQKETNEKFEKANFEFERMIRELQQERGAEKSSQRCDCIPKKDIDLCLKMDNSYLHQPTFRLTGF